MPDHDASPAPLVASGLSAETFVVDDRVIACDGGDGGLGHPRVWLRIEHAQTFCPYCSRVYVLNKQARHDHGH